MEFERSEEGVYVPADMPAKRPNILHRVNAALGGAWLTTSINGLMVLIQLFTVLVLWLTYQNTVIPTRQKELLSEQLAQLELERKEILEDIKKTRSDANTASLILKKKQEELQRIATEREALIQSVKGANTTAAKSLHAAEQATAKAKEAIKGLSSAQMILFEQHGSMLVATPQMKYMSDSINKRIAEVNASISDDDKHQTLDDYFSEIGSSWPKIDQMAIQVSQLLRSSKSSLFPENYAKELASYMLDNTRSMSCEKPDFAALRRTYEKEAAAYREKETKETEETDAKHVADGLKEGVRYVFTEEGKKARTNMIESSADYFGREAVHNSVDEMIQDCFDKFEAVADAYFKEKGAIPQSIPDEVPLR